MYTYKASFLSHIFAHFHFIHAEKEENSEGEGPKNPGSIVRHIEGCYNSAVSYGVGHTAH